MKGKLRLSGVGRLRKVFADKRRKATDVSVDVGYTANYAFFVHEMVNAVFKAPGTQAKFLEQPARELQSKLGKIIETEMSKGRSLEQALLIAGLFLQAASQKICPIDTGNLKASAFTRKSTN